MPSSRTAVEVDVVHADTPLHRRLKPTGLARRQHPSRRRIIADDPAVASRDKSEQLPFGQGLHHFRCFQLDGMALEAGTKLVQAPEHRWTGEQHFHAQRAVGRRCRAIVSARSQPSWSSMSRLSILGVSNIIGRRPMRARVALKLSAVKRYKVEFSSNHGSRS